MRKKKSIPSKSISMKTSPKRKRKKHEEKEKAEEGGQEEEEKETKKEEKKKGPFDHLEPTTFNLDDFKREFLNTKDKKGAFESFWKKFDENGWSFWMLSKNMGKDEGKVLWLTSNNYRFFLQKCDTFRRWAFSVHGIYGDEGNYKIKGLWMWRGKDIAPQMKEHESYESYTYKQLDHKNPAEKALIEEYWEKVNEGDIVEGQKVAEVDCFR